MINPQKLIVVIGMHRTGTSLITRGLQVMGVELGNELLPAMEQVNAKGFWEDADINAFNIELLHALKSEWDFLTPITSTDVESLKQDGYFLAAVELLRKKIGSTAVFGIKDPRIAKLLPFWQEVFNHCQYDVHYLLTIRHPLSVVKSLQKRDGFSAEKSYLLWLTHVVSAFQLAQINTIPLVDYDFFMQQPSEELKRLANAFGLVIDEQELTLFLKDFIDPGLRHSVYELKDLDLDTGCPALAKEIYQELLAVSRGTQSVSDPRLDAQVLNWLNAIKFGETAFTLVDSLSVSLSASEGERNVLAHTLDDKLQLIVNLEQFNCDYQEKVDELSSTAKKLDMHIVSLDDELMKKALELQLLYGETQDKDLKIKDLDAQLNAKTAMANAKEQEVNTLYLATLERDKHIKLLDQKLAEANLIVSQHQQVLRSRSWRYTKPLRFFVRVCKRGLLQEDKRSLYQLLRRVQALSPAPIQRCNRWLYRKLVRPNLISPGAELVRAGSYSKLDDECATTAQVKTPMAASSGRDFIVWGVIDWHFRHQRPQQIALALAQEGDRVFYISSNLQYADQPSFSLESLGVDGRLFQVNLALSTEKAIYYAAPTERDITDLSASLGELLLSVNSTHVVNIVQHPFWYPLARLVPNSDLIYDCMDHHEGFGNVGDDIIKLEHGLFSEADLTVTTSAWLDDIVSKFSPYRAIVRNAGDYEHFSRKPASIYQDARGRKIIGYYGAIAEWFDITLIEVLASEFPDACILLVGADTVDAKRQLKHCKNVVFTGEVSYQVLPEYLYAFDVCLLPFQVIPLTLATNPVKVYEYLGAGKPVVCVDLPEISQFGTLVTAAKNHKEFVAAVAHVLNTEDSAQAKVARQEFAQQQTWHHRARALAQAIDDMAPKPKVSIIVLTYNNLDLTKACLYSLEQYTRYSNLEVIVVDNASADGSPDFLREWVTGDSNRILILNEDNKGFAAGNNVGLVEATGDYIVMLNNDTYVTPGWLGTLVKHAQRDSSIGLIGPVTNNIGNEAKINIGYATMEEMLAESRKFNLRHIGQLTSLPTAAFFCVMLTREAYEKVGLLDEAFGRGFFEDDDYCRRAEQAGLRIVCADDVFVHHHLSASFNKLKANVRQELFETNKATYEAKWGEWVPHNYRPGVF